MLERLVNMSNNTTLSERIKKLRDERGWGQSYVADKLGVKANTLSGYENGKRTPDADMIKKLSIIYDVTTDYLIGRSDRPSLDEDEQKEYNEIDDIIKSLPESERKKVFNMIKAYADMTHAPEDD